MVEIGECIKLFSGLCLEFKGDMALSSLVIMLSSGVSSIDDIPLAFIALNKSFSAVGTIIMV
jgi:hypothetical protein